MKKIVVLILLTILNLSIIGFNTTFAAKSNTELKHYEASINRSEMFAYFANYFKAYTPESYKYIDLKYSDVKKGTNLYKNLQILVYHNHLPNTQSKVKGDHPVNAFVMYSLAQDILGIDSFDIQSENKLKQRYAINNDYTLLKLKFDDEILKEINKNQTTEKKIPKDILIKQKIFEDVMQTLEERHYDNNKKTKLELYNSAIEGLAKGMEDKHTTYFPPQQSKDFKQSLEGEFEGIGAYVDLPEPGKFLIVSPISGSPAYKAGLKGGDQVTHVDGRKIGKDDSSAEIVSWIKGKKGTKVILTISRNDEVFDVEVIRDKIIIKDVEHELIKYNTYLITIKNFGAKVSDEFESALQEVEKNKSVSKIIIDLRNNGGGYLDQVNQMLGNILIEGEPTAVIKYLNGNRVLKSKGNNLIDLSKYQVVILQNSGTASASEILIGTLKDYYSSNITVIGEQSYGKGSVQELKQYSDGSILKFTTAKWYTGKSETGIDGVGITPDIEIELDMEKYKEGFDNQLEKALKLK